MKRRDRVVAALVVLGLGAWATSHAWTQMGLAGGCTVTVPNVGNAALAQVGVRTVTETGADPTSPWIDQPLRPDETFRWHRDSLPDSQLEVRWVDTSGALEHWRLPVYIVGDHYREIELDVAQSLRPRARCRTRPRGDWSDVGPVVRVGNGAPGEGR